MNYCYVCNTSTPDTWVCQCCLSDCPEMDSLGWEVLHECSTHNHLQRTSADDPIPEGVLALTNNENYIDVGL